MKAVLLQTLYMNGVRVPFAPEGPTIVDLDATDFETLAERGVVRAAEKSDLALLIEDAEIIEEIPAKTEKPTRARKAEPAVTEEL